MNTNVIDATDATVEGLIAQEGISIRQGDITV